MVIHLQAPAGTHASYMVHYPVRAAVMESASLPIRLRKMHVLRRDHFRKAVAFRVHRLQTLSLTALLQHARSQQQSAPLPDLAAFSLHVRSPVAQSACTP